MWGRSTGMIGVLVRRLGRLHLLFLVPMIGITLLAALVFGGLAERRA